jgi:hypothetical protein
MMKRFVTACIVVIIGALAQITSAQALSMQECSAKYKAAKEAGTLGAMKWNDFRRAQCGAGATAELTTGNTVFPNAISSKYARKSAGKARMLTCLDQYRVNKTNGGNGGLKWIQKGGGYYSECNRRLKGQA